MPLRQAQARALRLVCLFVMPLLLAACTAKEIPYEDEIATRRADIDRFMRESSDSPIPQAQRANFPPLPYYPVNAEYRVPASLAVAAPGNVMEMPTSTGQRRRMRRIGSLEFMLKDTPLKLTAFAEESDTALLRLFVPFFDRTNGTETYPGGRYLDLDRTATGVYDLDFNRAYSPYCHFNPAYDCPVPPRENRLAVPVRAGEKLDTPK